MDVAQEISSHDGVIKCIHMHTCGEPTRIIYAGFPETRGTLLDQRDEIQNKYNKLRKMLMHEPRGHHDMYGALLRARTELTETGEADIGVLFMHNSGLSTMCGHASLALARFLVDTHDHDLFPRREHLEFNAEDRTLAINLHAPCGLVRIISPTNADGTKSDTTRLPRILSVPVYAPCIGLRVPMSDLEQSIPRLPDTITIDLAYGGAFYAIIDAKQFTSVLQSMPAVELCTRLKRYLCQLDSVNAELRHADPRMRFLYGVALTNYDQSESYEPRNVDGHESAVLVFADDELDRSPTGSCVAARMALAHAKGTRSKGQRWAYNSFVSNHFKTAAFCGEIVDELEDGSVVVQIEGKAFYTGTSQFIKEKQDAITSFLVKEIVN